MKVNGGELNLLGGITEQPADRRADGTVEVALNMMIDPVNGLRRCNPWKQSRYLNPRPDMGDYTYYIDVELIDATYTLIITQYTTGNNVRVYIHTVGGGDIVEVTTTSAVRGYLLQTNPQPDRNPYRATGFDNTLVVTNIDEKPTIIQEGEQTGLETNQKYATLRGTNYNRTYTVTVASVAENYTLSYSFTTPAFDDAAYTPQEIADRLQPSFVLANLASQIESDLGNSVFHGHALGEVLYLYPDPDEFHTDMTVVLDDGDSLANFHLVDRIITSLNDLPTAAKYGDYLTVRTSAREKSSEYYLVYASKANILDGVYPYDTGNELVNGGTWVETNEIDTVNTFSHMPIALIRASATSWSAKDDMFSKRVVGNDENNKAASFITDGNRGHGSGAINSPIVDLFYVQNRLALLTAGSVIMSQTNKPFNLWRDSAVVVIATDRIDVKTGVSEGGAFTSASTINDDILLLTDRAQYGINASVALTPSTTVIRQLTKYPCRSDIDAVSMGSTAAIVVRNGESIQVREIAPRAGVTGNYTSESLTAQIPTTIGSSVYKLISAPNDSTLLVLTDDAVYSFYWYDVGEQRAIQAWTVISSFSEKYDHVVVKDSVLYGYVITKTRGEIMRIDALDIGLRSSKAIDDQDIYLNQRQSMLMIGNTNYSSDLSSYLSDSELTDFINGVQTVIDDEGYPVEYVYDAVLNRVTLFENVKSTGAIYYFGYFVPNGVTINNIVPKDQEGNVVMASKLVIRDVIFRLYQSGIIKFSVSVDSIDDYNYTKEYETERIISLAGLDDVSYIRSQEYSVPVREESKLFTLNISAAGADPLFITGYEWTGDIRSSGQRRIW